jgi:2,5-diketo-D-gluconate reductase B
MTSERSARLERPSVATAATEACRIGLGTYQIEDPETCATTVARALETGYRHVDTAQMYENEAAVGAGIDRADVPRDEVVVATKIHPRNLSYEDVLETAAASRDRLGVETIDLLYVHWPVQAYDPDRTLAAFNDLLAYGTIRHVGLSNFTPTLLDEALDRLDEPPVAHQVECHPFYQQRTLREYARDHDHWLVGYCPLARGGVFDDPTLAAIAEQHGVSEARVTLAWFLRTEATMAVPKARGAHVDDNHEAFSLALDEDELAQIDALDRGERFIDDTPDGAPVG